MKVVISTGAGVSRNAGLGTYRGLGGLWIDNPGLEKLSTTEGIAKHPELFWEHWGKFRTLVLNTEPTKTHTLITEAQKTLESNNGKLTCVTQNVDGLHQRARTTNVIELHGNIFQSYCINSRSGGKGCDNKRSWVDHSEIDRGCVHCGGKSRPAVVAFGEQLPQEPWQKAQGACLGSNLYIAVGTSGMVYPASELVTVAKRAGAKTILVNEDEWEFSHPDFDETLLGDCDILLEKVLKKEVGLFEW